ncbi:MAG: DUF2304 domain-containing protein [Lachnospiraceae bacterium]|nr:DUF2304 domain-containing protein [Lachnospiraceae bacterium]
MESGVILRIIMFAMGVILFCASMSSLARRRMTEPFCLTWGFIALIIIFAGILLRPDEWSNYISGMGMLLVVLIGFCVVYGAYFMSCRVSELMRRNLELSMQVSLLNLENEKLQSQINEIRDIMKRENTDKERTVR